jgi:hypothetical protein
MYTAQRFACLQVNMGLALPERHRTLPTQLPLTV